MANVSTGTEQRCKVCPSLEEYGRVGAAIEVWQLALGVKEKLSDSGGAQRSERVKLARKSSEKQRTGTESSAPHETALSTTRCVFSSLEATSVYLTPNE